MTYSAFFVGNITKELKVNPRIPGDIRDMLTADLPQIQGKFILLQA